MPLKLLLCYGIDYFWNCFFFQTIEFRRIFLLYFSEAIDKLSSIFTLQYHQFIELSMDLLFRI